MSMPMLHLALLMSAVGALLSLDDNVLFRWMFAQPIVCGSILGLAIGNLRLGATVGAILQLLWLFDVPAGGFISIDYTCCTTISLALMLPLIHAGFSMKEALVVGLPFFVLVGMLGGALSSHLTKRLRRFNEMIVQRAVRGVENGNISSIWRNNTVALLPMFAKAFIVILVSILAGIFIVFPPLRSLLRHFDISVHGLWIAALPAAGIGIGLSALREHHSIVFAGVSMIAALVIVRINSLSAPIAGVLVFLSCFVVFLAWLRLSPNGR